MRRHLRAGRGGRVGVGRRRGRSRRAHRPATWPGPTVYNPVVRPGPPPVAAEPSATPGSRTAGRRWSWASGGSPSRRTSRPCTGLRALRADARRRLVILGARRGRPTAARRAELRGLAESLGVAGDVELPGSRQPVRLHGAAAPFVLSSAWEGFGTCWWRRWPAAARWSAPTARAARPRSWTAAATARWCRSATPRRWRGSWRPARSRRPRPASRRVHRGSGGRRLPRGPVRPWLRWRHGRGLPRCCRAWPAAGWSAARRAGARPARVRRHVDLPVARREGGVARRGPGGRPRGPGVGHPDLLRRPVRSRGARRARPRSASTATPGSSAARRGTPPPRRADRVRAPRATRVSADSRPVDGSPRRAWP